MPEQAVVSIGLPVYNNEQFIAGFLDSVLAQDYSNFDLIICDDCSSDSTEQICRDYAERDERIRYIRNEETIGPLENHRKVLALAESDYFMFARGHEVLPPDLLSKALDVLQTQQNVVLACAPTRWVNETGDVLNDKFLMQFDTRGCDVATRCLLILWGKCESFYGVGLTQHFRSIRVLEPVVGTDLIMLIEMGLLGAFAILPCGDRLRRYYYQEDYGQRIKRHTSALISQPDFLDRHFPVIKLPFKLLGSIWHGPIRFRDKVLATLLVLLTAPFKYLVSRGKAL